MHKEKKGLKNEQIDNDLRDSMKWSNTLLVIKCRAERKWRRKIIEETLAEFFPNLL